MSPICRPDLISAGVALRHSRKHERDLVHAVSCVEVRQVPGRLVKDRPLVSAAEAIGPSASPSTAALIRGSAAISSSPTRVPWETPQNPTGPGCSASTTGTSSSERTTATVYPLLVRRVARATTPGEVWSWPPPGASRTNPRGAEAGLNRCMMDLPGCAGTQRPLSNSGRTARARGRECPASCRGNGTHLLRSTWCRTGYRAHGTQDDPIPIHVVQMPHPARTSPRVARAARIRGGVPLGDPVFGTVIDRIRW